MPQNLDDKPTWKAGELHSTERFQQLPSSVPDAMRVLLVHPPIYDFTAFDFWMKPYGMLRVAGRLRDTCKLFWYDYLIPRARDSCGRGRFPERIVPKPAVFSELPRHFRRFGRPRAEFRAFLAQQAIDLVLIQTGMTYWYLGVREAIEDVREFAPRATIVMGGVYATLCPDHACSLGADLVIESGNLEPLHHIVPLSTDALPYRTPSMGNVAALVSKESTGSNHSAEISIPD